MCIPPARSADVSSTIVLQTQRSSTHNRMLRTSKVLQPLHQRTKLRAKARRPSSTSACWANLSLQTPKFENSCQTLPLSAGTLLQVSSSILSILKSFLEYLLTQTVSLLPDAAEKAAATARPDEHSLRKADEPGPDSQWIGPDGESMYDCT